MRSSEQLWWFGSHTIGPQPHTLEWLKQSFGPLEIQFRGRGEEFAVTPLTFVAEKCQYRGSLEFFTVGTVCVDAVLDFAKFLGVEEVARK